MNFLTVRYFLKKISPELVLMGGFFLFLTVGLFLGDGKQPLIDSLASVVIISLYIFAKFYLEKNRRVPKTLSILWILNLGYFFFRTLFSDAVGYSITTTMRMVMAYLLFSLFYEYANTNYPKYFIKGLVIISFIAILSSLYFILNPSAAIFLPLMNLLYANYGHNNVANLLIIVYPISLLSLLKQIAIKNSQGMEKTMINRNSKYFLSLLFPYFYYFILVISLFLSFSRGTLLLMGFYTIFQIGAVGKSVIFKSKRTLLIATIAVFSISSFIIFSYLSINSSQLSSLPRSRLERQLYKPLLLNEGRIQYFQQAIAGIKERPFLGHGPGTFYLISKRYQERPNHYSWFAHNFILQELSEIGIIGTIFLIVLISYPLLNNKVLFQRFSISQYFLASIYIILLNSLFDFNLDFLIIWLILWSLLSLISIKNLDRY